MSNVYPLKCRIRNAGDSVTRVDVYDDIGAGGWFSDGVSAGDFAGQLAGVKGALEIHINSAGGDVFDGIAIGNTIRDHKGPVTTVVDGLAASIASVISQAGTERVVQPGSMLMIHDAFGVCQGNAAEMARMAGTLDDVSANIASIYAGRSGKSQQSWRDAMKKETWYTAEEAVAAGLADRVGGGAAELPAGLDLAALGSIPGRIAASLRTMPVAAISQPQDAARHDPMTGTHAHPHPAYGSQGGDSMHSHEHTHSGDASHSHSHTEPDGGTEDHGDRPDAHGGHGPVPTLDEIRAAVRDEIRAASGETSTAQEHGHPGRGCWDPDGDGDCDLTPEADTDHDYWAPDGTQLKSVPGKPMPAQDRALTSDDVWAMIREGLRGAASVDNSPWDASKAWHNGAEADDPAAFYAGICAGKKDGDKSTQAAWALPYKYDPGDGPNAAGVKNALARLPQTEGLTNEAEAKATLQAAMKKINPDYEAEDAAGSLPAGQHDPDLSGLTPEQFRAALRGANA